jgi:hypothetical protein
MRCCRFRRDMCVSNATWRKGAAYSLSVCIKAAAK